MGGDGDGGRWWWGGDGDGGGEMVMGGDGDGGEIVMGGRWWWGGDGDGGRWWWGSIKLEDIQGQYSQNHAKSNSYIIIIFIIKWYIYSYL